MQKGDCMVKKGMEIGQRASIKAVVTPEMYAQFEGEIVHPVYSTVSMVYHMEWAARQIILPYLEDHEEGVGGAVKVKHLAPTTAGMEIIAMATLTKIDGNEIVCDVEVVNSLGVVAGRGEVTQYIVHKDQFYQKIKELSMKSEKSN
jgi:fluoroacetyl-CoA thioesterase